MAELAEYQRRSRRAGGAFAVAADVREAWAVVDDASVLRFDLFGEPVEVTEALLRVSGGIAAFSGLYYRPSARPYWRS